AVRGRVPVVDELSVDAHARRVELRDPQHLAVPVHLEVLGRDARGVHLPDAARRGTHVDAGAGRGRVDLPLIAARSAALEVHPGPGHPYLARLASSIDRGSSMPRAWII